MSLNDSFKNMEYFNEENQCTVSKFSFDKYGHKTMMEKNWKQKFWQVFPIFCASLLAVPFGMMLGWPSPTYPYLLQPTSEIPISLSQSAMIAGFLMLGVTIITPFSTKYHLGPKYGIWIGLVMITLGWIIMWYSRNIYWILGSRLVVGLGAGYGMGQIKGYIHDMCEPPSVLRFTKQLNFYGFFGLIITFATGPFLNFRKYPFIPVTTSLVLLFITMFLPCTPKDLIKSKNIRKAVILLDYLRGKQDHTNEIKKIQEELTGDNDQKCLTPIFKDRKLRLNLLKFVILIFLQQFSGAPTTLVYCQIIFKMSHNPYEEYCAILYSIIFFTSHLYGTFYLTNFNKKSVLIFSSVTSSFFLLVQILILYFKVNESYWNFSSMVVLSLFILCYNIGIGTLPITYIQVWFPQKFNRGITNIFQMEFCMMALIATKIFQVLFAEFNLYSGFCMFLIADLLFLIFVLIFIQSSNSLVSANANQRTAIYFWNANTLQQKCNTKTVQNK